MTDHVVRRRWREYRTAAGRSPVGDYLDSLADDAVAEVAAAMREVRDNGLEAARHVRGEVYEVRAGHDGIQYRVLFAMEGRRGQVLLALEGFDKKTRKTPPQIVDVALARLRDWRERGRQRRRRDET